MTYYDDKMRKDFKKSQGSVVAWLLMASWLYYHECSYDPILSDTTFDKACRWLLDNFESTDHRFKHLVDKEDLRSGSLYSLRWEDYPHGIIRVARALSRNLTSINQLQFSLTTTEDPDVIEQTRASIARLISIYE